MPVYDIYSRRKRRAEHRHPDPYQYETIPQELRLQVCYILDIAIGPYPEPSRGYDSRRVSSHNAVAWIALNEMLCREKGLTSLSGRNCDPKNDCFGAIRELTNIDDWLDIVDFYFRFLYRTRDWSDYKREDLGIKQNADDAIQELNFRLREAGVGYQFEAGEIVRVDSQLLHSEVVKPALVLLSDPRFAGAQDEFLSAHAHYRAGEHEDAVLDANRAFESTLKTICEIKGWEHPPGARASDLVKVIRGNDLLPVYLERSFHQLISTLSSGLPKIRNAVAGHGQGVVPRQTPGYIAGYALHLAAANIVLLVEALRVTEN